MDEDFEKFFTIFTVYFVTQNFDYTSDFYTVQPENDCKTRPKDVGVGNKEHA
jgi:hypothetical protein